MKKTDKPVVVEQFFEVDKNTVWNAITKVDMMVKWFFKDIETFEPKIGFETRFVVKNEDRVFPHLWKITQVTPNEKIIYGWRYEGYEGDSFVSFELFEENQGTLLRLTHTVVESFTASVPEFSRQSCEGGWQYFIQERLSQFLNPIH